MTGRAPPAWYRAMWVMALPLVAVYLLLRARRQREYLLHWGERFLGSGPAAANPAAPSGLPGAASGAPWSGAQKARLQMARGVAPCIWVHAVSLGETRAARALILALAQRHPDARFLLTHMTPTGRDAGAEIALALPGRVRQCYLPYDLPWAAARFMARERPALGLLMETEIWPEVLHAAASRGVPVALVNARLSERSRQRARRTPVLMAGAAGHLAAVGAQTPADAGRLREFFAGPLAVTGNLKFDQAPDPARQEAGRAWRARLVPAATPVWLFASTREGEEELLLQARSAQAPGAASGSGAGTSAGISAGTAAGAAPGAPSGTAALWLVVPRHPQRFDEVAAALRAQGLTVLRRQQWAQHAGQLTDPQNTVLLGDSLGEMALYYAMADAAFVGGSLLPLGGQNLIEACAAGVPVVFGPHMFNFAQAAQDACAAGAARFCSDAPAVLAALAQLQGARAAQARAAALAFAAEHAGATQRTLELLGPLLPQAAPLSAAAGG